MRSQNSTVTVFRASARRRRFRACGRDLRLGARRLLQRGQAELRILREDLLVQPPERGAGLDAEPVDEGRACRLVRLERLGLPARPVQGEHQLGTEVLAERVQADERLELADQLRVASVREIELDPLLDARQAKLLQTGDLGLGEALVGEVRQRFPPPLLERLLRFPAVPQDLKTAEIELLFGSIRSRYPRGFVSGAPGRAPCAAARRTPGAPFSGGVRRLLVPEGLDQPLVRNHAVRMQGEHGEGGTLFGAAEVERAPVVEHFERAEDAEIHRVCLAATLAPPFGDLKALNPAVTGA